jgi:DNA primase
MLAPALDTLRPHQYATGLLLHISTLADPEPFQPGRELDLDIPPDPAEEDLLPPPDLHENQPSVDGFVIDGVPGQLPGLPVEPVDDSAAPADPLSLDTSAPEQIDTAGPLGRARGAVAAAWTYYRQQAARSWAPQYLIGRGLDPALAGYAPAGWTKLVDHLQAQGFTSTELLAAGLARTGNRDSLIDRFTNRVMLPIHDTDGTVTAFIGRKHPTDTNPAAPKYLNSPTTDLFRKSELPYGLTSDAAEKLRGGADLVLVEGPMDAEAINAAAAANGLHLVALAPLGTALTAVQLATINDIAPLTNRQVMVALDNDPAGIKASRNAFGLLAAAGVTNPHTITLPAGHDPAQVLADHGPAALADALTHRRPLADLVIDDITGYWLGRIRPGGWGIEEGFNALQEAAPIIAQLPEPERNRQAERLAAAIDFDPFTVLDTIEQHVPYSADPIGPLGLPRPPKLRSRTVGDVTPTAADAGARAALTDAMARLEHNVQQLQRPADASPDEPDARPSRDDDRRDARNDRGPSIGM